MYERAVIGSPGRIVMVFESRVLSAWVTKHFATFLVKHVINGVISLPDTTSYDKGKKHTTSICLYVFISPLN